MHSKQRRVYSLTAADRHAIDQTLTRAQLDCKPRHPDQVIAQHFGEPMTRQAFYALLNAKWIDDQVINAFFKMLKHRDYDMNDNEKTHGFFNSYFYQTYMDKGYEGVYSWTRPKTSIDQEPAYDVRNLRKLFFPINIADCHWVLAVLDLDAREALLLDPLGCVYREILDNLVDWFNEEIGAKYGESPWSFKRRQLKDTVPQQQPNPEANDQQVDCGIHVLLYADCLAMSNRLAFDASQINGLRRMIAYELYTGQFLDRIGKRDASPVRSRGKNSMRINSLLGSWLDDDDSQPPPLEELPPISALFQNGFAPLRVRCPALINRSDPKPKPDNPTPVQRSCAGIRKYRFENGDILKAQPCGVIRSKSWFSSQLQHRESTDKEIWLCAKCRAREFHARRAHGLVKPLK